MDFVVHKVVQFQQVLDADRNRARELLACTSVKQDRLTAFREASTLEAVIHVMLFRAVKDWRRNWNTVCDVASRFDQVIITHDFKTLSIDIIAVSQTHRFFHRGQIAIAAVCTKRVVDVQAKTACGPTHVCFQNLTNVHT